MNLANKHILITVGTGFFVQSFVKTVLKQSSNIGQLVVLSRNELKQYEMYQKFVSKIILGCVSSNVILETGTD